MARGWSRKKRPALDNQKILEEFVAKFNQAFAERIKHREEPTTRDQNSSLADPSDPTRTSHNDSSLALLRGNSKATLADSLKQVLERMTKKFNATCSVNKKIRNEINVFRKERTLYDHVFKNLESLILQEEKKLLTMLKKNNEIAAQIRGADENLTNIVDTVSKFKNEDFLKVIEEEKERYDSKLRKASVFNKKSILVNLRNPDKVEEPEDAAERSVVVQGPAKHSGQRMSKLPDSSHGEGKKNLGDRQTMTPMEANEMRVLLIERLVKEFKYKTEENSIEALMQLRGETETTMEDGYLKLREMEVEVG